MIPFSGGVISMKKLAIVLGMHRSGTSLVSKALSTMGFEHGDNLMSPQPHNPKGFFEDLDLVDFNEMLLKRLGSSWDSYGIDCKEIMVDLELRKIAKELIQNKLKPFENLVLKDPRVSSLIEFWVSVLSEIPSLKVYYVNIIRNPNSVVASLLKRDGRDTDYWMDNWYITNKKIVQYVSSLERFDLDFDLFVKNIESTLKELSKFLGATLISEKQKDFALTFFDQNLVHNQDSDESTKEHPSKYIFNKKITIESIKKAEKVFDSFFWQRRISEILDLEMKLRIAERDAAMAERERAVAEAHAERDGAVAERDSAVAERDSAVAERDSAVAERDSILNSTIWRISKPYRKLKNLFKN